MTKIHLLGSEGFIGRAVQREARAIDLHCWSHSRSASAHHFDLLDPSTWQALLRQQPTHVILLSWPGLPNYQELFHVTRNLPACIDLVQHLIDVGLQSITVVGTCYEYGLQNGALREDQPADPINCYAIAKDALRRVLSARCEQERVQWSWLRIFYPFGEGQNPGSLLPSLGRSVERGDSTFAMSSGRQIRDFLPVEQVARHILSAAVHPLAHGIYNSCSGSPRSLREIVETRLQEKGSDMVLRLGVLPDREDEPLAFWGCPRRINELLDSSLGLAV